ncbi:MAG: hypothetical protein ABSG76_07875 [Xanthobacteraceae bacterium]|jgi:hypothetical protein
MIGLGKLEGRGGDGTDRPAPGEAARLYHHAFRDFGAQALWNLRQVEHPTAAQALAITRQLRIEGNMEARRLAEAIERACGADI